MKEGEKKFVLVTGIHRGGTTWIGKLLSANPNSTYIHEPLRFSKGCNPIGQPILKWYEIIDKSNSEKYKKAFQELSAGNTHLASNLRLINTFKDALSYFALARLQIQMYTRDNLILKDPFAVFNVNWFRENFDTKVIIVVRHPLAFVASIKASGWNFDVADLMDRIKIKDATKTNRIPQPLNLEDLIGIAIALWNLVYNEVANLVDTHCEVKIIYHEICSIRPVETMIELYKFSEIKFSKETLKLIEQSTSTQNPVDVDANKIHNINRNSKAAIFNWRTRLSEEEIQRVIVGTESTAKRFYQQNYWENLRNLLA